MGGPIHSNSSSIIKEKNHLRNIYRAPKDILANYETFIEDFQSVIKSINKTNHEIILTGDLNIDLLKIMQREIFNDFFNVHLQMSLLYQK